MFDFACPGFYKFARIKQEMKKILFFILTSLVCIFNVDAAVRGKNTSTRGKTTTTTVQNVNRSTASRNTVKTTVSARSSKPVTILMPKNTATRTAVSRQTNDKKTVTQRAAATTNVITETKTGAAYEQCKTAFFTCMDQFCELKNDAYRRCSCSDRIFTFQDIADTYKEAGNRLTEFSENLDVVGMTREQAIAMKTASEGEDALTEEKSVSKQLLQAIMNSINGGDTSVSGKYKDLNSITISSDMTNAFGMEDSGQIIASYNGTTLYKAVYPKCINAVEQDCNKSSLQRAINAYLMAIEQDCNTVEAALQKQQKTLKASTHQSSAMLDLARVENHQKHNSDDIATCIVNVKNAIQSEEVCGSGYHKCLDNGQFIDVATGAPLTGIADFYKLADLLTFKTDKDIKDQKLSSIQNNAGFVQTFESKTKKFALASLDKCSDDADLVWKQYLDMALLDIYYAQQAKVKEIKQSCLDLVANCYDNQSTAIANAMANLTGDSSILLKPSAISLTTQMCSKYIESCNGMFAEDIVQTYIQQKDENDTLNACRAVAKQCFEKFGGEGYHNFYYTQSGLFELGSALDWFSLYDENKNIVSPCATQLSKTVGCIGEDGEMLKKVFGGFDKTADNKYSTEEDEDGIIRPSGVATEVYREIIAKLRNSCNSVNGEFVEHKNMEAYGYKEDTCAIDTTNDKFNSLVKLYGLKDDENMCPLNYEIEVDTKSWGICSCWQNGGYRSKDGKISMCKPILPASHDDSADKDPSCTEKMLSDVIGQDKWCDNSKNISGLGQICPNVNPVTENKNTDITVCSDKNSNEIHDVTDLVPAPALGQ